MLVKFEGYRGKYVFHCHNLEHELELLFIGCAAFSPPLPAGDASGG